MAMEHRRQLLSQPVRPAKYQCDRREVEAYERGQRVDVWVLRRDTALPALEMSRALHPLRERQFVTLFNAHLDCSDSSMNAKFVALTSVGAAWLSAKKIKETKLALTAQNRPTGDDPTPLALR
jgi:hypothetical protein